MGEIRSQSRCSCVTALVADIICKGCIFTAKWAGGGGMEVKIWHWLALAGFLVMARDKLLAVGGLYRVPEVWLLALALAGGWPGILLAMVFCAHKVTGRKWEFQLALAAASLISYNYYNPGSIQALLRRIF